MQIIECSGSPYEIGYQHGTTATAAVQRSIEFYTQLFQDSSKLSWAEACEHAKQFEQVIERRWPRYHEEIRGIADGSGRDLLDIVALNCRTEIVYGLLNDGCTSAYVRKSNTSALLGQNWDWQLEQIPNLLLLTIAQTGYPTIKMVTEAGIIGKIGLNSAGVGVCLNALRIKGVSPQKLPTHLALRCALEANTAKAAAAAIESEGGLVSSANILMGDKYEAIGLECTSDTVARQQPLANGTLSHANKLLFPEAAPSAHETDFWVRDSTNRCARMNHLLADLIADKNNSPSLESFAKVFHDEKHYPLSICRASVGNSNIASLFNIVMDLERRVAVVTEGRPTENGKQHVLRFDQSSAVQEARL